MCMQTIVMSFIIYKFLNCNKMNKSDTHHGGLLKGDDLRHIYENRFDGRLKYRKKVWSILIRDYFQQYIDSGGAVLDLGSGYCEFINQIKCAKKYALDLNPKTGVRAGKDVKVILQDCLEPWSIESDSIDVVFTSNFFEHLPDKQRLANLLEKVKNCLKVGGRLIAMGPNIKYAPGSYWDFWDHYIPLTENSLSEALVHAGFTIEKSISKFTPFTMAKGIQYPMFFVAAYLRFPLFWRFFGKQFVVIAKKDKI